MTTISDRRSIRVGVLAYGLDRPGTGIARYIKELVQALVSGRPDIHLTVLQPFSHGIPEFEELPRAELRGARLLPLMMAVGPLEIAYAAHRHRLDVVHDPVGIAPFIMPWRHQSWSRVVTIHDMVPFIYPETHSFLTNMLFKRYIPSGLRHVDHVITVSDSSKKDIQRFYRLEPSMISRIHCGVHQRFRPQSADAIAGVCRKYQLELPYLLAVGALQPRKNLRAVIDAFVALRRQGMRHQLVLVGPKAWKSQVLFQELQRYDVREHVRLTGYVADEDLPAIYAGAACFVFPSLYEGFGLPPLEAMSCGTPVVVSNNSSLPDVVGDAGLTADPHNIAELTAQIGRVLTDPGLADSLRARGIRRSHKFTWSAAAEAHAEVYWRVAREPASQ